MIESRQKLWRFSALKVLLVGLASVVLTATLAFVSRDDAASEGAALIDLGASNPVLASPNAGVVPLRLVTACARPDAESSCSLQVNLHFRANGGSWESMETFLGSYIGAQFPLPVSAAGTIEYYFEAIEPDTNTRATLPEGGAGTPLTLHLRSLPRATRLDALAFENGAAPEAQVRLTWGAGPGQAGLDVQPSGVRVGPTAFDVDHEGNVYLLDQVNDRIQVFDRQGTLTDLVPMELGAEGDIAVAEDGTLYLIDIALGGPGSPTLLHRIVRSDVPFSTPASVQTIRAPEDDALRIRPDAAGGAWVYSMPSDAWHAVFEATGPSVRSGMPDGQVEVLRRVSDGKFLDLQVVGGDTAARLTVPVGRLFGPLHEVERVGTSLVSVFRTWRENPDQHHEEVVAVSPEGQVRSHFGVDAPDFAELGRMGGYRVADDGTVYQLWNDEAGVEIRRFGL